MWTADSGYKNPAYGETLYGVFALLLYLIAMLRREVFMIYEGGGVWGGERLFSQSLPVGKFLVSGRLFRLV